MWCIKKGYKEHIKWKWTLSSHSFCWSVANFWPNTNLVKLLLHIPIYGFANIVNWLVGKSHCCKNLTWRIWAWQWACCLLPSNTLTIVTFRLPCLWTKSHCYKMLIWRIWAWLNEGTITRWPRFLFSAVESSNTSQSQIAFPCLICSGLPPWKAQFYFLPVLWTNLSNLSVLDCRHLTNILTC